MITIHHATYDPDGKVFAVSMTVTPVETFLYGTIAATVANRVKNGWRQTSPNQVAKVDRVGFLDVVTFEEMAK